MPRGSPDGQQIWECLAVLVAIDIWSEHWQKSRIVLKVKADNVSALTLLIQMRPGSPKIAIIARELALRLVELSFPPDALHTPGVAHVIADRLSRVYAPGASGIPSQCHHALAMAAETATPARYATWYRSSGTEPATQMDV